MSVHLRRVAPALLGLALVGCEVEMLPSYIEPGLRPAVADPAVLAPLCGVSVEELGPVSNQGLTISSIQADRSTLGTEGHGTAEVTYVRIGGGAPCRGTVSYDFEESTSHAPPTIRGLRVAP